MSAPATRNGQRWVIAAPSGAGKTSLVKALLERDPSLRFSTSYTTRKPRPSEIPGQDYFFVSDAEFRQMERENAFLEYAQVFDHWYGTGRDHVAKLQSAGFTVVLEIDWQGARQVRARAPESHSVFILPPSVEELERRLRGRKTDSDAVIARRLFLHHSQAIQSLDPAVDRRDRADAQCEQVLQRKRNAGFLVIADLAHDLHVFQRRELRQVPLLEQPDGSQSLEQFHALYPNSTVIDISVLCSDNLSGDRRIALSCVLKTR